MESPMRERCAFAVASYMNPRLLLSFFECGQYFAIYARNVGNNIFKWTFTGFNYKGMMINDADLNVTDFLNI